MLLCILRCAAGAGIASSLFIYISIYSIKVAETPWVPSTASHAHDNADVWDDEHEIETMLTFMKSHCIAVLVVLMMV